VGTTADIALLDSDYNAWGSASGTIVLQDFCGADTPLTFAGWQALGKDAHSIVATMASLVDTPYAGGAYDYHLKAMSAAAGAGIGLPDLGIDLDGVTWATHGPVNMGCYASSK
jgi:hypothetical protein